MKAVYEMPQVSFEAFMANNAVSACGYKFDCVTDGDAWNDLHWVGDSHNAHLEDCEPAATVVANVLGMSGCTNNAGFADLVGFGYENDTPDRTDNVVGLGAGLGNSDDVMYSTKVGEEGQTLMGWLYITLTGGRNSKYTSENGYGWYKNKNLLCFNRNSSNLKEGWHAWLAPVYSVLSTSGM